MAGDTIYTKTYACTLCGTVQPSRDRLTVKKASFHTMGSKAKTLRSRVQHWLCPSCLKDDVDWNREAYSEPGEETPAPQQSVGNKVAEQLLIPGA